MSLHDEAAVAAVRAELKTILDRLDSLDLYQAGAHVSMAIHSLPPNKTPTTEQECRGEDD